MQSLRNKKAFSTILAAVIIVIVVAAAVVVGAAWYLLNFPSNQKTQTYTFTDFTAINVSSAFKVNVTQSSQYSIVITAMRIWIKLKSTSRKHIDNSCEAVIFTNFNAQAQITMPKLESVVFSGALMQQLKVSMSQDPSPSNYREQLMTQELQAGNVTTDIRRYFHSYRHSQRPCLYRFRSKHPKPAKSRSQQCQCEPQRCKSCHN
jgi:hypothetical protein